MVITAQGQQCFQITLDVIEIHSSAAACPTFRFAGACDNTGQTEFLGQFTLPGNKRLAGFKQTNTLLLAILIVLNSFHQAW